MTTLTANNLAIRGFRFGAVAAGIKKAGTDRLDFGLIVSDAPAQTAGVTTTNLVCAAPVEITRKRLQSGFCQAVLLNSGNANAYTGDKGKLDALELTRETAEALKIDPELVIPMSTGVIGNPLPIQRMRDRIPDLVGSLAPEKAMHVAKAIMTTDTRPKTFTLDGETTSGPFRVLGMAKGAGMMAPDMATMLCVILADIKVRPGFLKECLAEANSVSFNCITVDGDTSTNDTLVVMAGGRPDAAELGVKSSDCEAFFSALKKACMSLALQIVQDGEGATKVVEVRVIGAATKEEAAKVARKVAESPLVKTAFHGEDPNWGRIVCSAGRAGVSFDPGRIDLCIGGVPVVLGGVLVSEDWETAAHAAMKAREFQVLLDLKSGSGEWSILTTDMSEEYVTINADYRS